MLLRHITAAGILVLFAGGILQAQTIHWVDVDNCPGPGTGTESDPFCQIQAAIDASTNGDTVLVMPGTYKDLGTNGDGLAFDGKVIALCCDDTAGICILDGDYDGDGTGDGRAFLFVGGEDSQTVVDGFTVMNGKRPEGGAIYCSGSSPTIQNCRFEGNKGKDGSWGYGGAIYCTQQSEPLIDNCVFENNRVPIAGGAIYCEGASDPTVSNCVFYDNRATNFTRGSGGAIGCYESSPWLLGCTFRENHANTWRREDTGGGAISIECSSHPTIDDCVFLANSALGHGGAVWIGDNSDPVLNNCLFVGHFADVTGGAVHSYGACNPTFSGCTFVANRIGPQCCSGGAIWHVGDAVMVEPAYRGTLTLTDCVFAGNWSPTQGGAVLCEYNAAAVVTNCVFTGNEVPCGEWGSAISHISRVDAEDDAEDDAAVTIINSAFIGNRSACGGAAVRLDGPSRMLNSILWDNLELESTEDELTELCQEGPSAACSSANPLERQQIDCGDRSTVRYTCIEGLDTLADPEGTNIGSNPAFIMEQTGQWTAAATFDAEGYQTTFTDANSAYAPGALGGMFLNPDVAQYSQTVIVDNTATTITVWGDYSIVGTSGDSYKITDVRLGTDSPCINAGWNYPVGLPDHDLAGDSRIQECRVDMGAYESASAPAEYNDCNSNGEDDDCEVFEGASADCNQNHVPDECDIAAGTSYDADGDGRPDECAAALIVAARSCLTHGGAGEFCVDLGLGDEGESPGDNLEPRLSGIRRLKFDLDVAVASVDAYVACPYSGTMTTQLDGDFTAVVEFSEALPNDMCCIVTLTGDVADTYAVDALAGDLDRDRIVNSIDSSYIKARFGQAASADNFIADLNLDGVINSIDYSAVKSRFGNTAESCPP